MNRSAVEVLEDELESQDPLELLAAEITVPFRQQPICLFIKGTGATLTAGLFVLALHLYLGQRLLQATHLAAPLALAGWMGLLGLFLSMPMALVSQRIRPVWLGRTAHWAGFMWFGGFALTFVAMLLAEALGYVALWTAPQLAPVELARMKAMGVVGLVTPAMLLGLVTARGRARVEEVEVEIAGLGAGLDGLRIVQLSDMHVGPTLGRRFVQRVVDQVNGLHPDVVAITGDLIDAPLSDVKDDLASLAELKTTLGAYYVTGNHEYYHGASACEAEVRRLGVVPLHNEHRVIERNGASLTIAGVTDHEAGHSRPDDACSPSKALAGAPAARKSPRLLLAHQPRTARLAEGLDVALQLSGHTHGGQLFPFHKLVLLQQPVVKGLKTVAGTPVYTHRGTGYWGPPLRLGPAPEIAVITLRRGK